jgi:hypothetical protein
MTRRLENRIRAWMQYGCTRQEAEKAILREFLYIHALRARTRKLGEPGVMKLEISPIQVGPGDELSLRYTLEYG